MYERSYGYRYAELGNHPTAAQIAAAMRQDIKQAVAEGLLPSHWSYSVTSESYSQGQAVNLEVRDCLDAWQPCDGLRCHNVWCEAKELPEYAHGAKPHDVLTDEAEAAKMTLQRIHNAYNHDGSETQVDYFDVRYYGHVEFEDASSARWRAEEKARLAAKKAARESGTVVGRVKNHKRDGSHVVHLLIETPEGKKVLGCGARIWSGSLISRVADDTAITCSRCAKR